MSCTRSPPMIFWCRGSFHRDEYLRGQSCYRVLYHNHWLGESCADVHCDLPFHQFWECGRLFSEGLLHCLLCNWYRLATCNRLVTTTGYREHFCGLSTTVVAVCGLNSDQERFSGQDTIGNHIHAPFPVPHHQHLHALNSEDAPGWDQTTE